MCKQKVVNTNSFYGMNNMTKTGQYAIQYSYAEKNQKIIIG